MGAAGRDRSAGSGVAGAGRIEMNDPDYIWCGDFEQFPGGDTDGCASVKEVSGWTIYVHHKTVDKLQSDCEAYLSRERQLIAERDYLSEQLDSQIQEISILKNILMTVLDRIEPSKPIILEGVNSDEPRL